MQLPSCIRGPTHLTSVLLCLPIPCEQTLWRRHSGLLSLLAALLLARKPASCYVPCCQCREGKQQHYCMHCCSACK